MNKPNAMIRMIGISINRKKVAKSRIAMINKTALILSNVKFVANSILPSRIVG